MHAYYAKNLSKFRKEMDRYLKLIAAELESDLGKPYSEIFEEAWTYYRTELLEHFPYIGGDQSSGTKNLTGAYAYVSLGVVCRKYGMSLERWGYLITLSYQRFFEKIPRPILHLTGKLFTSPRLINQLLKKKDAKNEANAKLNPGSFETQTLEPSNGYQVVYLTTVCPLANFARKYGYEEYMPYLCNLDYAMFAAINVPFYREKTCAAGDGCCDFKLKLDAPVVPAWPCHDLDPKDPLK